VSACETPVERPRSRLRHNDPPFGSEKPGNCLEIFFGLTSEIGDPDILEDTTDIYLRAHELAGTWYLDSAFLPNVVQEMECGNWLEQPGPSTPCHTLWGTSQQETWLANEQYWNYWEITPLQSTGLTSRRRPHFETSFFWRNAYPLIFKHYCWGGRYTVLTRGRTSEHPLTDELGNFLSNWGINTGLRAAMSHLLDGGGPPLFSTPWFYYGASQGLADQFGDLPIPSSGSGGACASDAIFRDQVRAACIDAPVSTPLVIDEDAVNACVNLHCEEATTQILENSVLPNTVYEVCPSKLQRWFEVQSLWENAPQGHSADIRTLFPFGSDPESPPPPTGDVRLGTVILKRAPQSSNWWLNDPGPALSNNLIRWEQDHVWRDWSEPLPGR